MSARAACTPDGYVRLSLPRAEVVALASCAHVVRAALGDGGDTLYAWAERHEARRVFQGRLPAYAVPLPDGATRVVVRHTTHGGWLAPLTRDLFLAPTRAPIELAASLRLRASGVPTPELVAYVVYRAGPALRRADVATREVPGGRDLGAILTAPGEPHARRDALDAVADLLRALARAGARHPDLNVKNILLAPAEGRPRAHVLDVDRVVFARDSSAHVAGANVERLLRSVHKWRARHGAIITDAELQRLAAAGGARGGHA